MKIKAFCYRWRDGLIWLPVAVAAVFAAKHYLPQLDPSAGVDGLGFIYGLATALVAFCTACFVAWLAQVAYGIELTDDQERDLVAADTWRSLMMLALPWFQWFAVFWLVWAKLA